jgi:hypothetical protein
MIKILLFVGILIFNSQVYARDFSKDAVPEVELSPLCFDLLKNRFKISADQELALEDCVAKYYEKLHSYNAYTYAAKNDEVKFATNARVFRNGNNKITAIVAGKEGLIGGELCTLDGLPKRIFTYEAPLSADIFASMLWKNNINTYVTLVNEKDNHEAKLQVYRGLTVFQTDLNFLDKMAKQSFSYEFKVVGLKTLYSDKNIDVLQATLQRFNKKRTVIQIKYKTWIDDTAISMPELTKLAKIIDKYSIGDAIGVNCFAGLHRTKTTVLSYYLHYLNNKGVNIDVQKALEHFNDEVFNDDVKKYGEQAPAWQDPNKGQYKLLIDFSNSLAKK